MCKSAPPGAPIFISRDLAYRYKLFALTLRVRDLGTVIFHLPVNQNRKSVSALKFHMENHGIHHCKTEFMFLNVYYNLNDKTEFPLWIKVEAEFPIFRNGKDQFLKWKITVPKTSIHNTKVHLMSTNVQA